MDWVVVSKLLTYMIYPVGLMVWLLLAGYLLRWAGWRKSGSVLVLLGFVTFILSSSPRFAVSALGQLERQFAPVPVASLPDVDTIVLLGGSLALPIAPRLEVELVQSSDRILHAVRLYKAGKARRIFISGGNVFKGFFEQGEADYMRQLMIDWGVPDYVIDLETESRSTRDNALQTQSYLTARNLQNEPFLLVTSASHMPRAIAAFRVLGLNPLAATTDVTITSPTRPNIFSWLPSVGAIAAMTTVVHEFVGLVVYRLRGWAD